MVQVEFLVLGPLEVLADGESVALGGPRPRAVLGTLLAHLGSAVPVERLIDQVCTGDKLVIDLTTNTLTNATTGDVWPLNPLGEVLPIIEAGGIFPYAKQTGMLK